MTGPWDDAPYAAKAGRLDAMYSSLVWTLERQLARWEKRYAAVLDEIRESDASNAEAWGSAQGRRVLYEEHIGTLRRIIAAEISMALKSEFPAQAAYHAAVASKLADQANAAEARLAKVRELAEGCRDGQSISATQLLAILDEP